MLLTWELVLIFMYTWMWQNSIVISLFEKTLFLVMWLNSLYYCSDVSITDSVIMAFFEVFRLCKFVSKIHCTENYLVLHETNDIYENSINQGLIWNLFWYIDYVIARNFAWHALEPCKVKVLGFFETDILVVRALYIHWFAWTVSLYHNLSPQPYFYQGLSFPLSPFINLVIHGTM